MMSGKLERLLKEKAGFEKALDNILEVIAFLSGNTEKSYRIDDRELTRRDLDDLIKEEDALIKKLNAIDKQLDAANGGRARKCVGSIPRDF